MKPSDEQIAEWYDEYDSYIVPYRSGHIEFAKYIAHKAYAAGRESMREEAERECFAIAERYREQGLQLFEDAARECGALVGNLPTSEGGND